MKGLKEKSGMSYREIAFKMGKGESQVQRWFRGEVVPGGRNLQNIASALGVTVSDITGDADDHDCAKFLGLGSIAPITREEVLLIEMHRALDAVGISREIVALADKILAIEIGKRKK